jgi:hypothetical protein
VKTVPPILHPDGSDDPRSTNEQFLDLLLADEELLLAEFDIIIAAEWSGAPSEGPGRGAHGESAPRPATATRPSRGTVEEATPPLASADGLGAATPTPTRIVNSEHRKAGDRLQVNQPTPGDCSAHPHPSSSV